MCHLTWTLVSLTNLITMKRDIFVVDEGIKRLSVTLIHITQILFHILLQVVTWIASKYGRGPLIGCS